MRVAVFGTRKLGYEGIKKLIESGHEVVFIATNQYEITEEYGTWEFLKLAVEYNIHIFIGEKLDSEAIKKLVDSRPDIGLSLYWRRILGEDITSIPRLGFLNVHAGPLPQYRGFASSVWQMLHDRARVECVVHQIVPGQVDNGKIYATYSVSVNKTTTINDVHEGLFGQVIEALPQLLNDIDSGDLRGDEQNEMDAVYSYPRHPEDGLIHWYESAYYIDLKIRALTHPYPGAYTYVMLGGKLVKLYIWKAREVEHEFVGIPGSVVKNDKETGESWVLAHNDVIAIQEAQYEGGDPFQPGKVWNSVQMRLGVNVEDYCVALQERIEKLEAALNGSR